MTPRHAFEVRGEAVGLRLDVAISRALSLSRSQAAQRIAAGQVTVDGHARPKSYAVEDGDRVEVEEPPEAPPPTDHGPTPPIRYEDDHVLVVSKPAGLVVHPGAGNPHGTLVQVLQGAGYALSPGSGPERPGVVHRLDKDTSGLLVLTKTTDAYRVLVDQLRRRAVERRYLALVHGRLGGERGRVDAPIGRDPRDRKRFAAVADGKPAITHWEVRETAQAPGLPVDAGSVSLLECRLETGRTHQIRVHLSYAGHPIVGDPVYGGRALVADTIGLTRPFLHAYRLAFVHPVTGQGLEFREALPADLADVAEVLHLEPG